MIRSPTPTTQPQPTTQQAMAPSTGSGRSLAAFHAQADREALHQRLARATELIEYGLSRGLLRLRRTDGRLIATLDQFLAAVDAKEWGE